MNANALVQHLVAWVQEESAAQGRLSQALEGLERALRAGERAALEECLRELEQGLGALDERASRQRQIHLACQRLTALPAGEVTLARVVEHAAAQGADVEVLKRLRLELRARLQTRASRARSLAVLVRHHRGVLGELLGILGARIEADGATPGGILMDARA